MKEGTPYSFLAFPANRAQLPFMHREGKENKEKKKELWKESGQGREKGRTFIQANPYQLSAFEQYLR